jgi:TonB family protein
VTPAIGRLVLFISGSLVLHSATFGFLVTSAAVTGSHKSLESGAVLHASLLRSQERFLAGSGEAFPSGDWAHKVVSATEPKSTMPKEAAERRLVDREHSGTANRVLFDRWYTAEELDTRAEPLTLADLTYPPEVMPLRMVGRVRLALFIDENGFVQRAKVIDSDPKDTFDAAAVEAWQHVRFTAAQKSGHAVKSEKILEIEFSPY